MAAMEVAVRVGMTGVCENQGRNLTHTTRVLAFFTYSYLIILRSRSTLYDMQRRVLVVVTRENGTSPYLAEWRRSNE